MKYSEIITEGPAFGNRGHGGFGQKFFAPRYYRHIAYHLSREHDKSIKEHLVDWFSQVFKLDNPNFKPDQFREACETRQYSVSAPQYQQRHFYFLAHEIAAVKDEHMREYLCHWVGDIVGSTNPYFQMERWEKYCNLPEQSWERNSVDGRREQVKKERGMVPADPVPAPGAAPALAAPEQGM